MLAQELPPYTDHGECFLQHIKIESPPDKVWRTLADVSGWPAWNPFVEWTSAQILRERENFTLLSAQTMLEAQVRQVERQRSVHLRCVLANRPQPPVADWAVALDAVGDATLVIAQLSVEPWFLDTLRARLPLGNATPVSLFLAALDKAVTRPPSSLPPSSYP